MKVLHLLSGDLWAGAEAASYELLLGLATLDGVEARAVLLNPGVLAERLAARGLLEAVEPERERSFSALRRAVARRLSGADLVHAHGYKQDVLAALSGRPWLSTQHGRPEPQRGLARARMAGYAALAASLQRLRARRVVAVSSEVARWLEPRVGREKVVCAWNGITDPVPGGVVPAWKERPRRVGVLCRLFPVKNLGLAVRAVAQVPGVELEVAGDGPEAPRLSALARELGAGDRVRLTGFDPEPAARLSRWRALLVPSLHEGNPLAVIEALAWGTPVVAGPLPGVAEMLDGRGGICLPDREPHTWQAALERALDGGDGDAIGRAGRARFLEAFGAEAAARRMLRIYSEALARTP